MGVLILCQPGNIVVHEGYHCLTVCKTVCAYKFLRGAIWILDFSTF